MNAKGDIFPLFSWLGIVLITLIIGYWFFSNFFVEKDLHERMENDLRNIRTMVDDACETKYYKASYNPFIEDGQLEIDISQMCIKTGNLKKCRNVLCERLPPNTIQIDLASLINVIVEKSGETVEIYAE